MAIEQKLHTLEEFWGYIKLPENENKRFELIKGVIYEVDAPSPIHGYIIVFIVGHIFIYLQSNPIGYVFSDSVSYTLSNGDEPIPDVSFLSISRVTLPLPKKFFLAPDLAVEVFSPSNREREMLDKAESYLESGTKLVWVVYPTKKVVDVYRRNPDGSLNVQKVDIDGTLDGEDVLPNFKLPVRNIFVGIE